jgi:hypothetical protein
VWVQEIGPKGDPCHSLPTETHQATLHRGAIHGLEDEPPMEGAIVSSRERGQN